MATNEEHALARLLFKCKAVLSNAKAFQDLFWDVMKAKHGQDFATVAPQGKKGDGGNDGYHTIEKHYYQVFAPVNPRAKVPNAVAKLGKDFLKVMEQWGSTSAQGVLKFSFVFNDKYEGAPKDIELKLDALRKEHPGISFAQYCCRDLESDFMQLDPAKWDGVLGTPVPDPARIVSLDYSVLGAVVLYIMSADVAESDSRLDLPPGLQEKIALNGLSPANAVLISNGALHTGHIEKYFKANSVFALAELQRYVVGVYEAAKTAAAGNPPEDGTPMVDVVFRVFRFTLFPKNATTATVTAVDAVIGYFFEACDVFDPNAAKGLPGASP
ncbi:MAG TPA: ABC-three component system protein [Pirellulales bacterium]|nr:ABC-three component system protein [Pirellulales bacterium]